MEDQSVSVAKSPECDVGFTIGIDRSAGQVTLTLEVKGPQPVKVRVHFEPDEVGQFCTGLLQAAVKVKSEKTKPVLRLPGGK